MRVKSAPAFAASLFNSIVCLVDCVPVPAIRAAFGLVALIAFRAVLIISIRSCGDNVAASPFDPITTTPAHPAWMIRVMCFSSVSRSKSSFDALNGVMTGG